jgi:hypothetical protein
MAWVPKRGAVARWRVFHRMTTVELVTATKGLVKDRTIRELESNQPRPTMNDETVRALSKAFTRDGIICHPEFLASWRRDDGTLQEPDPDLVDPTLPRSKAPPPDESDAPTSAAAKRRALTMNAERERNIGRHRDTVELPSGKYPLIGCDWLQELENQFADHIGQTFAVAGAVTDQRAIPSKAAAILQADTGRGAAQFKIVRKASGEDPDGQPDSVPLFPTVFAIRGEHGKALSRCLKEKLPVTVLVHIVTTKRKVEPGADRWEGFFFFEVGRPTPKLWALIVDSVIVAEETELAKKPKRKPVGLAAPGGVPLE